jgi:hypothetical protein
MGLQTSRVCGSWGEKVGDVYNHGKMS